MTTGPAKFQVDIKEGAEGGGGEVPKRPVDVKRVISENVDRPLNVTAAPTGKAFSFAPKYVLNRVLSVINSCFLCALFVLTFLSLFS